ncbi:hypothetical protein O7632_26155 [Solwaraspora sp. WMMD406]|uniref:hypothetical protein n=1 Tax=Solwaraspora sp. WMMD406 TaxID=3016095 RepID=UPI002416D830|nr:hypothetical protein [Solwaraspora sp. WMMD406]MDG4767547.1 hypothetical protein [Solwaraspora sp. WMMD406]
MTGTGIWGLLLACCGVLLALLALAALADRPPSTRPDRQLLRREADELAAEAAAIAAAAKAARIAADAARLRSTATGQVRDDAWQRQETAGRAYQQALRAARTQPPMAAPTKASAASAPVNAAPVNAAPAAAAPAESAPAGSAPMKAPADAGSQLERDVSRAALTAYRRGDISVQQLREVWRRAGDPDLGRHERDQTVEQHRRRDRAARREYDAAAAIARRAAEAAWIAELAATALAEEAAAATAEAAEAHLAAEYAGRTRRRR